MPVARVVAEHRGAFVVHDGTMTLWAEATGRLRHHAASRSHLPAVGDWVLLAPAHHDGRSQIHSVLPRRSAFSRKLAGLTSDEQVLAANIDVAFIVVAADPEINARRLERYLTLAWDGGASPTVVLTKADLCDDRDARVAEVEAVGLGVPVIVTSIVTGEGLDEVAELLSPHGTGVLLGPSGSGKSSLINALVGSERQATRDVRFDGKGRHTTTTRELITLPSGGMLIDTPGMREIALWGLREDGGLEDTFSDVASLAAECRFNDCSHDHEPGCAVIAAVQSGELASARLDSYRKLQRELAYQRRRNDARLAAAERRKWRNISKAMRA